MCHFNFQFISPGVTAINHLYLKTYTYSYVEILTALQVPNPRAICHSIRHTNRLSFFIISLEIKPIYDDATYCCVAKTGVIQSFFMRFYKLLGRNECKMYSPNSACFPIMRSCDANKRERDVDCGYLFCFVISTT